MVESLEKTRTRTASSSSVAGDNQARLELIYQVNRKIGSMTGLAQLLEQIIKMTQQSLNAAAASILLFRNNDQELYFEAASGPVGKALRQVKLNTQYGIAGQVARTGKPLIVNDVARSENFHKMIDDTTGFCTKSLLCAPLMVNRKILGVIEVLNKSDGGTFGERDLETALSVATTTAMAIENTRLQQSIQDAYKSTISMVAAAIDAKDTHARGHSQRVMEYSLKAGAILSFSPEDMETLEYAGIFHDIGKIAIDTNIFRKQGPLTHREWEIIQEHPAIGAEMLMEIPFLEKAGELVLNHHEQYDGKGYPHGIRGEDIPMGARLIAVANAFDAMTTDRVYRSAMSIEEAVKELHDNSGTQFCPVAVKALISGLRLSTGKK